jgi:hypothetical protein
MVCVTDVVVPRSRDGSHKTAAVDVFIASRVSGGRGAGPGEISSHTVQAGRLPPRRAHAISRSSFRRNTVTARETWWQAACVHGDRTHDHRDASSWALDKNPPNLVKFRARISVDSHSEFCYVPRNSAWGVVGDARRPVESSSEFECTFTLCWIRLRTRVKDSRTAQR